MRIERTCQEKTVKSPPTKAFDTIPNGVVFRYGEHRCGPYMKVERGIVDFKYGAYHEKEEITEFENYLELPNARLVTGEDE